MSFWSHLPAFTRTVRELADVNFRTALPGGRNLGEVAAELVAVGVYNRSVNGQTDASGAPWQPLSPKYLAWKAANGYSTRKNIKTGRMLSLEEIRGQVKVTKNFVTITYGLSNETRLLAEWATEGQSRTNRPPRPFFDMDEGIAAKLAELIEAAQDDAIRRASR